MFRNFEIIQPWQGHQNEEKQQEFMYVYGG